MKTDGADLACLARPTASLLGAPREETRTRLSLSNLINHKPVFEITHLPQQDLYLTDNDPHSPSEAIFNIFITVDHRDGSFVEDYGAGCVCLPWKHLHR